MHRPTPASPRRRTRRALLAAALPALLAAAALPSVAQAATVELVNSGGNGVVAYAGEAGEVNNIHVRFAPAGIVIEDAVSIRTLDSECRISSLGDAICPGNAESILVFGRDGNDTIQYTAPHGGGVFGGDGADTILGGQRQAAFGRQIEPVGYDGKDRNNDFAVDTVSYVRSNTRVRVELDNVGSPISFNDGRAGELEGIATDIDRVEGSNFGDVLFGSDADDTIIGLNGDDEIGGGGGNDHIIENFGPNGADRINGGGGVDRVLYAGRTSDVFVSLDGIANDGQSGEGDDVRPNVENVTGSPSGNDVLIGNSLANDLHGFGGADTLRGGDGNDTLSGGAGNNGLFGGAGNDVILARNGQLDTIDCGENTGDSDTADRDSVEGSVVGCESGTVGALRLAPKAIKARAGKPARLHLSWRVPKTGRKLRTIELRLTRDGAPVGEVTIRPRGERIAADGAVKLMRKHSRLTRKGKTVTARLAVRLDESLAGQVLKAEVEATDTRGRRQLERQAGTVRVAR